MPGSDAGAQSTVTVRPLAALNVTSNDSVAVSPASPSTTLGESIERVGALSSSVIVPVPVAVSIVAPSAFESSMATVSSVSSTSSPLTVTSIVFSVSPAAKVSVPPSKAS